MAGRLVEHSLGGIKILGYSVAGEETVIAAPELNVCFDVGKAPTEMVSIDHVLLSHGHMDHAAGLAYYFSQRNFVGNAAGCALVPIPLVKPIQELVRVWGAIEGHVSPAKIIGLKPNEDYELRRGLIVRTFDINHGSPSLGFCVVDVRRKLKPEYMDLTGPELVNLKKQGIDIEYTVEVPLIAYCGDTAEGAWIENETVRKAKVLVLECTFFEADHVRRAREGYHMHVRDFARLIGKLDNEHILATHVTRRTDIRQAKSMLAKMVSESTMARVTFLMDRRFGRRPKSGKGPGDENKKPDGGDVAG